MNYVVISYAMITNRARVSGQGWSGQTSVGRAEFELGCYHGFCSHLLPLLVNFNTCCSRTYQASLLLSASSSNYGFVRTDNFQTFLVEVFFKLMKSWNRTMIQKAIKNNDIFLQVVLVLYGCWEIFISSSLDALL